MRKTYDLFIITIILSLSIEVNLTRIFQNSTEQKASKQNHLQTSFDEYIIKYNKTYQNENEKAKRCKIFETNIRKLLQSKCSACGINKFTDFSSEQFQALRGIRTHENSQYELLSSSKQPKGSILSSSASSQDNSTAQNTTFNASAPKSFDWRNYGVITSVKNQLKCGVCWAFSTCAFFESQLIRRGQAKQTIDLSEQYLFQCDTMSNGCKGGNLYSPMDLVLAGGLPFETTYPYNPQIGYPGICRISRGPVFPFSSRITAYNLTDSQVIQYLMQRPLNIGIKSTDWQKYSPTEEDRTFQCKEIKNGIKEYNHAVLLVGYTETEWIVKNQWGEDWGVDGYMYITRNAKYNCGIGLEINTLNYRLKSISNLTTNRTVNETNKTVNSQTEKIVKTQEMIKNDSKQKIESDKPN